MCKHCLRQQKWTRCDHRCPRCNRRQCHLSHDHADERPRKGSAEWWKSHLCIECRDYEIENELVWRASESDSDDDLSSDARASAQEYADHMREADADAE